MAGQLQALFRRGYRHAHARMVLPGPMYCGSHKSRGRSAAVHAVSDRPVDLRSYDDISKSSTFADLNESKVGRGNSGHGVIRATSTSGQR